MQKILISITGDMCAIFPFMATKASIQPCKTITTCTVERDMNFNEWRQYIAKEASNMEYNNLQQTKNEEDNFMRCLSDTIIKSRTII